MIAFGSRFRIAGTGAALSIVLAACIGGDRSLAAAPEPYELVRTLSSVQSDVIRGRADALDVQRRMIVEIGKVLTRADIELFRQRVKNRRAVVKYVLSGGAPAPLRRLLMENVFPEDEAPLAAAALAYSEGRKADADQALASIEHRDLPRSLAGHVALVKALLLGASRQSQADALLDDARLLSPGTIVDEASLRRQIELASALDKRERVGKLTSRYLRRFPFSQYSKGMLGLVAGVLGSTGLNDDRAGHEKMGRLLRNLPPPLNHWVMGEIAQIALGNGNVETTLFALDHRVEASKRVGGEHEGQRMQLYKGAALVVTDAFDRGRKLIEETDPRRLRSVDRALLRAATQLAGAIRKPPTLEAQDKPAQDDVSASQGQKWLEATEAERVVAEAASASRLMKSLVEEANQ